MNRKRVLLLIIGVVILLTGFTFFKLYQVRKATGKTKSRLPDLEVITLSGKRNKISLLADHHKRTMIIYFDSKCGKCRDLLDELQPFADKLSSANILLLSAEATEDLKETKIRLNIPGLEIMQVEPRLFYETFGSLKTPQVFIYDTDQKLIANTQTNIDSILSNLSE